MGHAGNRRRRRTDVHQPGSGRANPRMATRGLRLAAAFCLLMPRASADWQAGAEWYGVDRQAEARSQGACAHNYVACAEATVCVWDGTSCSVKTDAPDFAEGIRLRNAAKAPTNAKCLDGSAPFYYIKRGSGSGTDKWFIQHQGGGWCVGPEGCALRGGFMKSADAGVPPTYTTYGSSEQFADTTQLGGGYWSSDPAVSVPAVARHAGNCRGCSSLTMKL